MLLNELYCVVIVVIILLYVLIVYLLRSNYLYTQGYGFEVDKLYEVLLEIRLDCIATKYEVSLSRLVKFLLSLCLHNAGNSMMSYL